jgi:hypothetical protein
MGDPNAWGKIKRIRWEYQAALRQLVMRGGGCAG